ncbi:MAG: NUDIX hydrolase [Muricauda sp.]|nr:NUDIX hydrolase [Allomuricauda sp.]MCR9226277.1 NUDIX domain-containing protein [Flavobacteriaceae bacterium]
MSTRYNPNQRVSVAIDCVIFGFDSERLKLLLFKRKIDPFKGSWSLIGELIDNDVSLDDSANQILYKLSGLDNVYLRQLKTYGAVQRDPLERVISVVYYSLIRIDEFNLKSTESHDAHWFDFEEIPDLILDHGQMVKDAIRRLRLRARNKPIGFELLPEFFTLPQLQTLYESIYNTEFDSRNFRKKILSLGILNKTNKKDKSTSRKGAFLYHFKEKSLENSSMNNGDFDKLREVIQF